MTRNKQPRKYQFSRPLDDEEAFLIVSYVERMLINPNHGRVIGVVATEANFRRGLAAVQRIAQRPIGAADHGEVE